MLKEMAGLGFESVELSHGIRIALVPGILRGVEEGLVNVASCHNFCPLPVGVEHAAPNLFAPSAKNRRERAQWLRHSRRSIDFANQVGAPKLVLHLGKVESRWSRPGRHLEAWLEEHADEDAARDPVYRKRLASELAKLRNRKRGCWENTLAGIAELLPYAASKGVALGFENREAFEELPLDEDCAGLVASMPPESPAGYWHDTGHAQIKQRMGILDHREHLVKNAAQILGFHLHDVSAAGRDHQPVGTGQVDFEMVGDFWRPEHTLVLELSPHLTTGDVLASKQRIEEILARRFGA